MTDIQPIGYINSADFAKLTQGKFIHALVHRESVSGVPVYSESQMTFKCVLMKRFQALRALIKEMLG